MKIAIAGYGIEGKSSYAYFRSLGHDVTILDQRPTVEGLSSGTLTVLGNEAFAHLDEYDMVVRTPSLPPRLLSGARKVWSATNEFFAQCPAPIIGVTGSKGKGTTCSFIAGILREAGLTVHLVGNIGLPALDVLRDVTANDVVVYELSSFQLWDIEKSPQVAVVLMIEADHLDIHADLKEYVDAKAAITRYQTNDNTAVYYQENQFSRTIGEASPGQKVPFPSELSAHVKGDSLYYGEQELCLTKSLKLPGVHNLDNACAAIDAAWLFTQDVRAIEKGLGSFTGLPHRLKFVRDVDGASYYDDSIATTPGSVVAAIKAFDQPKVLILGGSSKGKVDFDSIAIAASERNVKAVILIGKQADAIADVFAHTQVHSINLGLQTTMGKIVQIARDNAALGDVVILSPACASFDMFKNYADRGDQFVAAVNALEDRTP